MKRVLLGLCLVAVVVFVGCTTEQRENAGVILTNVAGGAAAVATGQVGTPWGTLAAVLSVILNGIAAVVIPRQSEQKESLKKAIQEFSALIDRMKMEGEQDPKLLAAVETVLAKIDKYKDQAPAVVKALYELFTNVRKGVA